MEYGRIVQTEYISTPNGSLDICTMRISETSSTPSKELYVKFPDGTEKQLTGPGSSSSVTASNGLTKASNDVKLGGTLIANTLINFGAFELGFNGTIIQRGTIGANKISGAGNYFSYIPSLSSVVAGSASVAQLNVIPLYSYISGSDNVSKSNSQNLFVNGVNNNTSSERIFCGYINSINTLSNSVGTSRHWIDSSNNSTFDGSIQNSITSLFNGNVNGNITSSVLIGSSNTIDSANISFVTGGTLTLGDLDRCIVAAVNLDTTDVLGSLIIGGNISASSDIDTSIICAGNLTVSGNTSSSIICANAANLTNITRSLFIGGTSVGAVGTISDSLVIALGSAATAGNIGASIVSGQGHTTVDNFVGSILGGTAHDVTAIDNSIIIGNESTIENATNSAFIGINQIISTGAHVGMVVSGVGSAAMRAFNGAGTGTITGSDYTLFVENIESLTPGSGIKLVSPNGLVTKIITIDNAGAIALL